MHIALTLLASGFILACALYIYHRIDLTRPPFVPEFSLADVELKKLIVAIAADRAIIYLQYAGGTVYSFTIKEIKKHYTVTIGSKTFMADLNWSDDTETLSLILAEKLNFLSKEIAMFSTYPEMIAAFPTLKPKPIHAEVR